MCEFLGFEGFGRRIVCAALVPVPVPVPVCRQLPAAFLDQESSQTCSTLLCFHRNTTCQSPTWATFHADVNKSCYRMTIVSTSLSTIFKTRIYRVARKNFFKCDSLIIIKKLGTPYTTNNKIQCTYKLDKHKRNQSVLNHRIFKKGFCFWSTLYILFV